MAKYCKKNFIDGLNLMQTNHTENSYSSLAQTCADLKEYANKHNIAIIVDFKNGKWVKRTEVIDVDTLSDCLP